MALSGLRLKYGNPIITIIVKQGLTPEFGIAISPHLYKTTPQEADLL